MDARTEDGRTVGRMDEAYNATDKAQCPRIKDAGIAIERSGGTYMCISEDIPWIVSAVAAPDSPCFWSVRGRGCTGEMPKSWEWLVTSDESPVISH